MKNLCFLKFRTRVLSLSLIFSYQTYSQTNPMHKAIQNILSPPKIDSQTEEAVKRKTNAYKLCYVFLGSRLKDAVAASQCVIETEDFKYSSRTEDEMLKPISGNSIEVSADCSHQRPASHRINKLKEYSPIRGFNYAQILESIRESDAKGLDGRFETNKFNITDKMPAGFRSITIRYNTESDICQVSYQNFDRDEEEFVYIGDSEVLSKNELKKSTLAPSLFEKIVD